jgi:glycosyltransferase involved in cell wall biosynthesis
MKVAHIITRMIVGGAQENTLSTVAGLLAKGHLVLLVSGPSRGPEGSFENEIRERNIPFLVIPELVRDLNPLKDTIALIKLGLLFRRQRFDIIHTHSAKAGIIGRLAARLFSPSSKVIHTVHGLPFHPYQNCLARFLYVMAERLVLPCTDAFIAVGEVMAGKSIRAGIGTKRDYTVIYSGFDLRPYLDAETIGAETRRKLGVSENERLLGMIGRLFPLKGHLYLLRVFARIVRNYPDVKLLLVGDGILRGEFERFVKQNGLVGRVLFAGLVPPQEIVRYAAAMDIGCHTSLREGLPRAVAQIMAAGKPVVAFDVDGAGEIVVDGETGFLVPPEDEATLEKRICTLLDDSELARRMGKSAQSRVMLKFSRETMVAEIEKLYLNILAR